MAETNAESVIFFPWEKLLSTLHLVSVDYIGVLALWIDNKLFSLE
jgi:hypothetical protein